MKVIGLAGPAGSGKSAVAQELSKQEGIVSINSDEIAWGTYHSRTPTYWRLVSRFGKGILDSEGRVDRPRLSAIVFSDEHALADLNAIVHPAVIDRLREIVCEEGAQGTDVLLIEGALLATSPHVDRSLFDAIIWLGVSSEIRRDRLQAAGRHAHIERTVQEPDNHGVVTVDAEGSVAEVAARVVHVIETVSTNG